MSRAALCGFLEAAHGVYPRSFASRISICKENCVTTRRFDHLFPCRRAEIFVRSHIAQISRTTTRMVVHPAMSGSAGPSQSEVHDTAETADTTAMLKKGKLIMQKLNEVYPIPPTGFLDHTDAFTLLVSVVLSAQTTDVKVNQVTPELFRLGGTPAQMRELGETKIRKLIQQVGLAPQKARSLAELSASICDRFEGRVPDTFEELESLRGVGHKTASVVMMQAFGKPAFPVDTHIHRLACRWGCGHPKSVPKTEANLKKWFPDPETWGDLHVRIILFGREYCPARAHDMESCPICSFAATDEARKLNGLHPTKFIASASHKNPHSIREVSSSLLSAQSDQSAEEDRYYPVPTKRRGRPKAASKAVKIEEITEVIAFTPKSSKRTRNRSHTVTAVENLGKEPGAKAVKRKRPTSKSAIVRVKTDSFPAESEEAHVKTESTGALPASDAQSQVDGKRVVKRVRTNTTVKKEMGADGPVRRSSRIRKPANKAM